MKLCFVIMPIGSGEAHSVHLNRYDKIIRAAVRGFRFNGEKIFNVKRADEFNITGSINKTIIQYIYRADVVIADLTELNANVFYELGVRHSLRKRTILLALEGTKIPFDVQDLNVIFYQDLIGGEKKAITMIKKLLGELLENGQVDDSPVFSFLPELQDLIDYDLKESRAREAKLEAEVNELRRKLEVAEATSLSSRDSSSNYERVITDFLAKLDPQKQAEAAREVEKVAKGKLKAKIRTVNLPSEIEENPSIVLVLMPFSKDMKDIYDAIRLTAKSLNLTTMRGDEISVPGRIVDQIFDPIQRSGMIIADTTQNNQNVMVEIGIAKYLGKKIIFIAEKGSQIPFDLRSFKFILYENTFKGMISLHESLKQALKTSKD